jgi:hypothetical protein
MNTIKLLIVNLVLFLKDISYNFLLQFWLVNPNSEIKFQLKKLDLQNLQHIWKPIYNWAVQFS